MVVFCGPTYLSRLWCIVELFTFVHMGRSLDKIDFVLVKREGHEDEDASSVEDSFDDFDAEECQCFLPEDKERIHTIILTAFGTVSGFNRVVQDIFRQSQMEETLMRQCSTVPGRVPSYSARSSPRNGADRSQPPSSEDSTGSSDTTSTSRNDGESEEDG